MTNPKLGQFELEGLQQMSDDKFEEYLQSACILYRQNQGPMSPELLRSLLIVLRYFAADEEANLKDMQAKGEDTKDHIAFELRRLAHWATINSWAIGSYLSWDRYGVRVERL
jgi:hypothetical protein